MALQFGTIEAVQQSNYGCDAAAKEASQCMAATAAAQPLMGQAIPSAVPCEAQGVLGQLDRMTLQGSPGWPPQVCNDYVVPYGEAFIRSTVERFIREAVQQAIRRDRQNRPLDGWVTRANAASQCAVFLAAALVDAHAPSDHALEIMRVVNERLDGWIKRD